MSESQLYDISQHLRLLARRNCAISSTGTLLQGSVDRPIECLRMRVLDILEAIQDRRPLPADHVESLALAGLYVDKHRSTIRELRREFA